MNKTKLEKFILILQRCYRNADMTSSSVLVAFYMLLSVFPLLILIGNLLPFLRINPAQVLDVLNVLIPDPLEEVLQPIIVSLLTDRRGGLLSISAVGLMWTASKGINYLQIGMNKAYGLQGKPGPVIKRVVSLATVLLLIFVAAALILVFSFGSLLLNWLTPALEWAAPLRQWLGGLRWPVVPVFLFCMLVVVYTITPNAKIKLFQAMPGAAVGSVGLILLSELFLFFVRFITRNFSGYSSLGSFFMLMFWMNYSATILIFGAVLNAAIQIYRGGEITSGTAVLDAYIQRRADGFQRWIKDQGQKHREDKSGGAGPEKQKNKDD